MLPIWKTYEFTNCKLIPFVDDDDDESRLNLNIVWVHLTNGLLNQRTVNASNGQLSFNDGNPRQALTVKRCYSCSLIGFVFIQFCANVSLLFTNSVNSWKLNCQACFTSDALCSVLVWICSIPMLLWQLLYEIRFATFHLFHFYTVMLNFWVWWLLYKDCEYPNEHNILSLLI